MHGLNVFLEFPISDGMFTAFLNKAKHVYYEEK